MDEASDSENGNEFYSFKRRKINPENESDSPVVSDSEHVIDESDDVLDSDDVNVNVNVNDANRESLRIFDGTETHLGDSAVSSDFSDGSINADGDAINLVDDTTTDEPDVSEYLTKGNIKAVEQEPIEIPDEPSRRPIPETLALVVNCIVPGEEARSVLDWETTRIFYKLEKVYGRNSVLSCNGQEIQKFKNPLKAAKDLKIDVTDLVLTISTERQLKDIQLRMHQMADGEEVEEDHEGDEAQVEADAESERFPITLQGKQGSLRVSVSRSSKLEMLLKLYLKEKGITSASPSIRFDGDLVDLSQTIGDLDIEEDENLDVYA